MAPDQPSHPTSQLRVYQLPVDQDEQRQWLAWWEDARAVRVRHGFRIVFAVLNPDTGVFTWLVEHDGDFAAAEKVMVASPERIEVFARARPAQSIIETAFVRRVV